MPSGGPRAGAGRPKGIPNKFGAEIKKAIHEALDAVGGKEYLIGLATSNPQVFCNLVAKIIPAEIAIVEPTPFEDMSTDELLTLAGEVYAAAASKNAASGGAEGTELPASGSIPAVH